MKMRKKKENFARWNKFMSHSDETCVCRRRCHCDMDIVEREKWNDNKINVHGLVLFLRSSSIIISTLVTYDDVWEEISWKNLFLALDFKILRERKCKIENGHIGDEIFITKTSFVLDETFEFCNADFRLEFSIRNSLMV